MLNRICVAAATLAVIACGRPTPATAPTLPGARPVEVAPPPPPEPVPPPPPVVVKPPDVDLDSADILARPAGTDEVRIRHVLIGWGDLADAYGGQMEARAKARSNAQAAELATQIADELRRDPAAIDRLAKEHSEDPGSDQTYKVKPDAPFVAEFVRLAMRLQVNEVGVVRTIFGYHVMMRIAPPPPDPLESAAILARAEVAGPVDVQHILIGYTENGQQTRSRDPRAARTKAEADELAKKLFAKVKAGGDMAKLMKEFSEDNGSKDNARQYTVEANGGFVPEFERLSRRLKLGEAGLVRTEYGWHIIKRVAPPPPDKLESAAILARKPRTDKALVKHILLGWKDAHATDPRGEARDRAAIDKLVKDTLARLKKGDGFEDVMRELSEDPGSSQDGRSYEATPDSQLVPPFKALSLRLDVGEIGVVKTDFGFHIIKRVE